jgi:thiamine phosphate synthase YjbQ (UPF0047 family)
MVLVSAMHITSSVYVNDRENGLIEDFRPGWKLLPQASRTNTTRPVRTTPTRT